ncbi:class I adenylate-forming enzyme family protein [Chloroflexota bacterium]
MNLKLMLEKTAEQHAGKTAIVMGQRRVSYAELDEASNKVANALIKIGVRKGDRVAMLLTNTPEFATVYFGIIKAGGIAAPFDTRYKIHELALLFNNCKPKVMVAESQLLEPLVPALSRLSSIEHVIELSPNHEGQFLSYQQIMSTSTTQRVDVELAPDDIATISYTSGPTTRPRGAMFSHHSLLAEAIISGDGFQQTDKDVVMLFALPLYHNFGLAVILLTSVHRGSTIIMVPGTGISISSLMEAIERERGTILLGVPYIYALAVKMAKHEGLKNDLSSLRLYGSGGAPLSVNTIRQFKQYYGYTIIDFWGLTEAVAQVTCQPIDGKGKIGASGKVLPGWEIRIVNDDGDELPPNQTGEIIVRGPIMNGYYKNPQATAETIKDDWLYTGDIGRIDEDGYLFITGRKKSMIILKGQNIYPFDIEKVLHTHPRIAAAKVIGIPDKLRGEVVRAIIIFKEGKASTEQIIRRFCQQRMADYKLPKQIVFTDALLKTAATKIRKKNLKAYLSKISPLPRSPYRGRSKS